MFGVDDASFNVFCGGGDYPFADCEDSMNDIEKEKELFEREEMQATERKLVIVSLVLSAAVISVIVLIICLFLKVVTK